MYFCPKCKTHQKDVNKLIRHLRNVHALSDGQDYTIVCSQNFCQRTYHNFNSYARHLNRDHPQGLPNTQDTNISFSDTPLDFSPPLCSDETHETDMDLSQDSTYNYQQCAAEFAAQIYSSSNSTLTDVQRNITCTKELLSRVLDRLQEKTASLLKSHNIPSNDMAVQNLMEEFESGRKMFEEIDTNHKMTKYFSDNMSLVKPREIFLGHRSDTERKHGVLSQTLVADTCQYIPILDTLRSLFENAQLQTFCSQSNLSTDGKMYDYCDGIRFRDHQLYSKYPKALQIQLYFDDLETTNPLGSKTKVHKLGAVYFCLRNLPPRFNSSLKNIHLCLLFNSIDKEVYGLSTIFKPLLDDIRLLETRGLEVQIDGLSTLLYGTLCLFTADNLACHSLGGYFESFAANMFCHTCLIDKQNAQHIFDDDHLELRNRDNYNEHVQLNNPTLTGIKENSCLNSLNHFHITESVCGDVMHDVLEGVARLELKLMLRHFIYEENFFTLEQLNDRIAGFDYGITNGKNKPSAIVNLRTGEIRQTASQMWCLLLFLPFFIGDFIDEGNEHWKLFLLLREICDIIFAPVVSKGLAILLKQLIIDHHSLFKLLYPDRPLIPKHHFMIHYWRMMIYFGPLSKLWCMRFEGKHAPLKRQAHVVCNFVNISKTLSTKHQIQQMFEWKLGSPLTDEVMVSDSSSVILGALEDHCSLQDQFKSIGRDVTLCSRINVSRSVCMFGQEYQIGCVLPLHLDERGEVVFGEVIHIFPECEKQSVLFFVRMLAQVFFHSHLHAFQLKRSRDFKIINIKDIKDSKPMHFIYFNGKMYVNPRYKIL